LWTGKLEEDEPLSQLTAPRKLLKAGQKKDDIEGDSSNSDEPKRIQKKAKNV
jgi:hypothetical protein